MATSPPPSSSPPFIPEPIPATILAEAETRRRDANREMGACRSGCSEVDDYVLLGGFERGSVVGVSCEDEAVGVTLAIQVLAHGLCAGTIKSAHVITPRPRNVILAAMRDGIQAQLRTEDSPPGRDEVHRRTRELLERVMLSCVFDMTGVWQVVASLDRAASPEASSSSSSSSSLSPVNDEIKDSQEDDEDQLEEKIGIEPDKGQGTEASQGPDVVVMTHFGSLLTGLFAHRSSASAHQTVQLLSSHLRHLSRSLPTSPLFLLLNSTASSSPTPGGSTGESTAGESITRMNPGVINPSKPRSQRPLDPTLRSIFNPPYIPVYGMRGQDETAGSSLLSRRNKPTFGLIFSQMLDMHILCTRVPKTDADADMIYGLAPPATVGGEAEYATVVEVLLDDMGVWPPPPPPPSTSADRRRQEEPRTRQKRRYREQRWCAVTVKDGRVVNAFSPAAIKEKPRNYEPVRLAAGFGGPTRV